jgi:DNA-binding CsgD family transcriptional regulator
MHVSLDTLRRATQFVDSLADLDEPDRAAELVLPGLAGLIGCDIATYMKINPEPHVLGDYIEYPSGSLDPAALGIFESHLPEHPLVVHRDAYGCGPAKISDMVSRQGFRRLGIYSEYFRHVPTDDQIAFTMPGTRDGEQIGVTLSRSGREFGDEDSGVLSSVMAPVRNALRRSAARHRARTAVAAEPDGLADLTGREMQVLDLAAAGRTNVAIARAIDVSPRTVAKHLEHIYRKLGVTGRAAAVYRTAGTADLGRVALTVRGAQPGAPNSPAGPVPRHVCQARAAWWRSRPAPVRAASVSSRSDGRADRAIASAYTSSCSRAVRSTLYRSTTRDRLYWPRRTRVSGCSISSRRMLIRRIVPARRPSAPSPYQAWRMSCGAVSGVSSSQKPWSPCTTSGLPKARPRSAEAPIPRMTSAAA